MKKVIICLSVFVVIIGLICTVFVGCADSTAYAAEEADPYFIDVYTHPYRHYKVVYDKDTKVLWAVSLGDYNKGTFTMLVNADGTPKLYEGN